MPQQSFMEALFGKKRKVKRRTRKTVKRKAPKRKVVKKKLPKSLKNMAKKHGVRVTRRRDGKLVEKSEKLLKKQIKVAMKKKAAKKKMALKKKKASPKRKAPKRKVKRRVKRKTRKAPKRKTKRRVKRRTAKFGKGAGFPPLSSVMSPYPYAISSSPPWI